MLLVAPTIARGPECGPKGKGIGKKSKPVAEPEPEPFAGNNSPFEEVQENELCLSSVDLTSDAEGKM
jgi:hypothetical protein